MSAAFLIGAVLLWGFVHSLLASLEVKAILDRAMGKTLMSAYRLGYNIFSVISFLPILWLMVSLPDQRLYTVQPPWMHLMIAGQAGAVFLLLVGFLQTDALSFMGLRQLVESNPEPNTLVANGLYRIVRHPLYSAGLLLLWLTSSMTVTMFVVYISLTIYILVGIYFEERKLVEEFGSVYSEYKSKTPMLVPGLLFKRNK